MNIDEFAARLFVRPGDKVFDVGLNKGTCTKMYLDHGASEVFGFEPRRKAREEIPKYLLIDPRFKLMPFALGDASGITEIYIPDRNPGAASIRRDFFEYQSQIYSDNRGKVDEVDICRLDDLNLPKAQFWKIDAEGAELEVLTGAQHSLTHFRPDAIQIEIFAHEFDRYEKTLNLVKSYFCYFWAFGIDKNKRLIYYDINSENVNKRSFHESIRKLGTPIYFASVKHLREWSMI
jgi:FkbM family methyltransferase